MMKQLRVVLICLLGAVFIAFSATVALSANPVETVAKGCEKELTSYCSEVTPGEGRLLACLYAYQDKLSGQCEYALYDAAVQLERAVAALTYVASSCDDDIDEYCEDVPVGKGRVIECLNSNKDKISGNCTQALKDVGL